MKPRLIFAIAFFSALSGCATPASKTPLPVSDVVKMSESGAEPEDVIERIRVSGTTYALRGSDFGKLKAAGVLDPVLDYLQQSFVNDVDLLTRYSVTGPRLGGCSFCYPQPLDLNHMVSGYGVASSESPGQHRPGLPAGVPDWVPSSLGGIGSKRIFVSDILDMSRRGVPNSQIIDLLHHARLQNVSGSEFARLRSEGVSDAVLDEIQARLLAEIVQAARLRYQNWI